MMTPQMMQAQMLMAQQMPQMMMQPQVMMAPQVLSAAAQTTPRFIMPSQTPLGGAALAGTALAGNALAGTPLAGTALAGATLPGAALAGTALATNRPQVLLPTAAGTGATGAYQVNYAQMMQLAGQPVAAQPQQVYYIAKTA